jgi:AraC-like DNA-binding protein
MHANTLIGFLQTILLLGVIQGLIASVLLWVAKENRATNRKLSAIIFFLSLVCFNLYGWNENWFGLAILEAFIDIIPFVIIMPIGPLLYFYVRASVDPSFRIGRKQRLQFWPVVIDLTPYLTAIGFFSGVLLGWVKNKPGPVGLFIDTYNIYADIPRWISISGYVWLSYRYLRIWKKKNVRSVDASGFGVKWLQQFLRIFAIFQGGWLLYLVPYVIPRYSERIVETVNWYPLYIPLVIMIYWLGIKGYLLAQRQRVNGKTAGRQVVLASETVNQVRELLTAAMETDKLYLNANITLYSLASRLNIPPKTVSIVLNQYLSKSFNEYVNTYRIQAFKDKIKEPGAARLTIEGLAQDCGFHSKATFQRVFKEMTGRLPSEFRKMEQKEG